MWKTFFFLSLFAFSGCNHTGNSDNPWPEMSFVILEENPELFVFEQTTKVVPAVNRVLLLPIVENYLWEEKRYYMALADPLIVEPGKETLRKTMSLLENNNQAVRACIVLARGYCPGILQPIINYAGDYKGRQVWLVELAKLSDEQFTAVWQIISNELSHATIHIGKEKTFEDALKEKQLISTGELLSPIVRTGEYRSRYVLWTVPVGTEVAVCVTPDGLKLLKDELLGKRAE